MANVYDIVIRPIITERSMASVADKKYVFAVAKDAGKIELQNASRSPRSTRSTFPARPSAWARAVPVPPAAGRRLTFS